MKLLTTTRAHWSVATVLLATASLLAASCSKNQVVMEKADDDNATKLVISINGVDESQSNVNTKGSTQSTTPKLNVQSFSDVDIASTIDNNTPFTTSNIVNVKGNTGSGAQASASSNLRAANLAQNVKYAIYLLSDDGSQVISKQDFDITNNNGTSTPNSMSVTPGTKYRWIALSYNNDNDGVPMPSITSANMNVQLPENQDVLYASGKIEIPSTGGHVALPITFKHRYSRIAIELNSIGVFGNMNSGDISVTGLNLKKGTLNLATNVLTPDATAFTPTINWSKFTNIDQGYTDRKIVYSYTADSITTLNNIHVIIKNLNITHADIGNVSRTYASTTLDANAKIDIPFTIKPEMGKSHRLLANVVESPLITNYTSDGGHQVKWGRSNLYYRNQGGDRNYAFYANNSLTTRGNGYFGFGGIVPLDFVNKTAIADVCAKVYPANLWRQPTKSDFIGLTHVDDIRLDALKPILGPLDNVVSGTGDLVTIITNLLSNITATVFNKAAPNSSLDPNSPYIYGQYTLASGSNGAPAAGQSNAFGDVNNASNRLRFYYNGQISDVNVLTFIGQGGLATIGLNDVSVDISTIQIASLGLPLLESRGKVTSLWTKDQGTNILSGLAGAGTWGYLGNAGRGGLKLNVGIGIPPPITIEMGDRFHMANNTGELLNGVSVLSNTLVSTSFKNVRCVRN